MLMKTKETTFEGLAINGFAALFINLVVLPVLGVLSVVLFKDILVFLLLVLIVLAVILMLPGYFSQEPNEARVMIFFGKYKGTFTETGFFWVNLL